MTSFDQRAFFKEVAACGDAAKGLRLIADAVRRRQLDAEGMDKAGRRCAATFTAADIVAERVLLLGQCTTTWVGTALTAVAWGEGRALDVVEGTYDNVLQELLGANPAIRPAAVVLLPWNKRLLASGSRSAAERVQDELDFWREAWRAVETRLASRIVQVGYDTVSPGALGYGLGARGGGDVALVRAVNEGLRAALPAGAAFVDLEAVAGEAGRRSFYDLRRYHWTKQPFSEQGVIRLAEHLSAALRAAIVGPRKVLVLDLDNTVWGGIVGEVGPLGITIGEGPDGEAFTAFQRHVKRLSERGIVLAVSSKNNDADAREPFRTNPEMVLSLDDFAQFEANWEPKAVSLRRIAKTLQLGLDSFVFFDDNPAEREHIRQALPDVAVVEVPEDPAEYVRALDQELWFEAVGLTDEDRIRSEQYRSEARRRDEESSYESVDAYLASLEMVADVRPIDDADMDRVVQLIGKTNQFNLTTRRHGAAQVRQMLAEAGAVGLTLRVADRFGDHGLVAVAIARMEPAERTACIDTWLMSCRVIGRTVEEFFFNQLVDAVRGSGARRLKGEFIPTAKNGLVSDLYDRLGFERIGTDGAGRVEYRFDCATAGAVKTFVRPKAAVMGAAS